MCTNMYNDDCRPKESIMSWYYLERSQFSIATKPAHIIAAALHLNPRWATITRLGQKNDKNNNPTRLNNPNRLARRDAIET